MKKVAFFDIDGTVFRSSLLIELVENLVKHGYFPIEAKEHYRPFYERWWNREGNYEDYVEALVQTFLTHIKGVHYGELADVGREIVAVQRRRVYIYTRDLISALKADNYFIIAVSQSPKTILDDFCTEYGFDKVYGRIYELGPQDRFTGKILDEQWIENKANIVKRVFDNNAEFTREDSLAVGDTEGDIPLLEAVEHPICFNPNEALYKYAKQMKWEIVVERKDVIYHI